jgi:hypothetical protein
VKIKLTAAQNKGVTRTARHRDGERPVTRHNHRIAIALPVPYRGWSYAICPVDGGHELVIRDADDRITFESWLPLDADAHEIAKQHIDSMAADARQGSSLLASTRYSTVVLPTAHGFRFVATDYDDGRSVMEDGYPTREAAQAQADREVERMRTGVLPTGKAGAA